MPFDNGPYVQAACFCETVLEDKSGALSLIRIIDTFNARTSGPNPPVEMPPVHVNLNLVIMLKAGARRGPAALKIVPVFPDGSDKVPIENAVQFNGEGSGVNFVTSLNITFAAEGLYRFKVYVDDEVITEIPLRVLYHRIVTG